MSKFFGNNPLSEKGQTAFKAMQELLEAEGSDPVHKIYAEVIHEYREQAYAKRYGLTKSSVQRNCLCRLVGKQCPWMYGRPSTGCIQFEGIDHFSLWNRKGKPFVYVSQPYGVSLDDMKSIVQVCEAHGLVASIDAHSWWYPDSTVLVEIHKEGWWQEIDQERKAK